MIVEKIDKIIKQNDQTHSIDNRLSNSKLYKQFKNGKKRGYQLKSDNFEWTCVHPAKDDSENNLI